MRLSELTSRIASNTYVVDPTLVAEAMLRRAGPQLGLGVNPVRARNPEGPARPTRPEG